MTFRENTSSGRPREPMTIGDQGAKLVSKVMERAERVEKSEHPGVRFEVSGGNKAHHAKRTPGAEKR